MKTMPRSFYAQPKARRDSAVFLIRLLSQPGKTRKKPWYAHRKTASFFSLP